MKRRPWSKDHCERILETRVFAIEKRAQTSPESGRSTDFFVLDAPDWVNVVAVTPEEKIVLIHQYRAGTEEFTIEIPGGMVDPGESPPDAAARELAEETGYTGAEPILIGIVEPNPAIQNNRCFTYLIPEAHPSAPQQLDPSEEITLELSTYPQFHQLITTGQITHALVVNAFYWYQQHKTP